MSAAAQVSPLHQTVLDVFADEGWHARPVPDHEVLEADFEGEDGKVSLHVQSFAEIQAVSVVARPGVPLDANPQRRALAMELLMRLNLELTVGGFEMNPDSGEVFYRVTNLFSQSSPDKTIITGLVTSALAEADGAIPLLGLLAKLPKERLSVCSTQQLIQQHRHG